MSLSDDARTAIANVTADPDDFTAGGRTIALACADEILAVVMPDGRTIAQWLDAAARPQTGDTVAEFEADDRG